MKKLSTSREKNIEIRNQLIQLSSKSWYSTKKDQLIRLFELLDKSEREIVLFLLKHILVHSYNDVLETMIEEIAKKIILEIKKGSVMLFGVKKEQIRLKSSDVMLYCLDNYFSSRMSNINCRVGPDISNNSSIKQSEKHNAIIILDDFSGTGDSIIKTYNMFIRENISYDQLYIAVAVMMEEAYQNIKSQINPKKIIACYNLKKGISDSDELTNEEKENYLNVLKNLSKKHKLRNNYCLGYKKCESIYSNEINTPNNTFGVLWEYVDKNGNEFPAIFPRAFKGKKFS